MSPFQYRRPLSLDDAVTLLQAPGARALGGGTDLFPLVRERLTTPELLVDLRALPESKEVTWLEDGSVRIGGAARLAHLARDPQLPDAFGMLADACAAVGSEAIRTMGTLGGNLCQRPRCSYFRHGFACFKRGDDRCAARQGENQYHAIFADPLSARDGCVAVHPSDPAVALTALEAVVQLAGASGVREVAIADFFTGSASGAESETVLAPGEMVVAVTVPAISRGGRQRYEKVLQRGAFDFALVSLAALKRTDGEVRLVLGGVALRPWRVTDSIEEDVASGGLSDDDIETLGARALYDARPLAQNGYKVEMASALLRHGIAFLEGR
jgi:xanthine dehydrogenase YagS FAD-binding subunit